MPGASWCTDDENHHLIRGRSYARDITKGTRRRAPKLAAGLSSPRQSLLPGGVARRAHSRGPGRVRLVSDLPLAHRHGCADAHRAAGDVQPSSPLGRIEDRLPLLPYVGREIVVRWSAAHLDVHDLPLATFHGQPAAPARPCQRRQRPADCLEPRALPPGLRVLQPFDPREQRRRLHDLPRAGQRDAADLEEQHAVHAMVPAMPPRAGESQRPLAQIYSMDWKPVADQPKAGAALARQHGLDVAHLTNCSVCHH